MINGDGWAMAGVEGGRANDDITDVVVVVRVDELADDDACVESFVDGCDGVNELAVVADSGGTGAGESGFTDGGASSWSWS